MVQRAHFELPNVLICGFRHPLLPLLSIWVSEWAILRARQSLVVAFCGDEETVTMSWLKVPDGILLLVHSVKIMVTEGK